MKSHDSRFIEWIKPCFKRLLSCQKNGDGLEVYIQKNGSHHHRIRIDFLGLTKNNTWIAIEFEDGDTFGNITKGIAQLEDFYRNINETDIICLTPNGDIIKPKYYFIATQYSHKGFIYKNDMRTIPTGGYSEQEWMVKNNWTIFCLSRMMWRLLIRQPYSSTNPIGCSFFGVIDRGWHNNPIVELEGKTKYDIENL